MMPAKAPYPETTRRSEGLLVPATRLHNLAEVSRFDPERAGASDYRACKILVDIFGKAIRLLISAASGRDLEEP